MSTVIFDFDGTLADTFPAVVEVTYGVTHARRLSPKKIEELRRVPLVQAIRSMGGKPWNIPFVLLLIRQRMAPRMNRIHTFPGMVATIKQLHTAGHTLYVLTSNRTGNVQRFLQHHGLTDHFSGIYHCSIFRKSTGIRTIIERKRLAARNSFYVGNEAADIDSAQDVGVQAIGITWSGQDRRTLELAQPLAVIDEPAQLIPLVTEHA